MKILMTVMGLDIGGAETHVTELARELRRRGHTVILAGGGGTYVPVLEAAGVRHVEIPMNQRDPKLMLRSLSLLKRLIRQEKPDLVHAHARIPAFLCGILQKTMRFPLITTAHGVFEVTPLLRLVTDWGDRTVAVSEDIRDYLMKNYQVPEDLIHVTVNGIDTAQYRPGPGDPALRQSLGLGAGPVIATVTRMDTPSVLRVVSALIQAAPALAAAFPTVELLVVGGGDHEGEIRALADQVNRQCGRTVVHMTGRRTDVADLLNLATVFVGVSRAALEAMSAGLPVVLAGNPDYDQGYGGILTQAGMPEARESNYCCRGCPELTGEGLLADLTTLLAMTPEERQALGQAGRQEVLSRYSVSRMAEDYLQAYDLLLHPPQVVHGAISGYYGYDNLGDDAILTAISRQLARLDPPVRLTVLSRRPKETRRRFGLRAVNRFSPVPVFRAIWKSDLLISGGGSLLQDRTSTRSLRYYLAVIRLAQLLGKPVFLFANGIGPLEREPNRRRVRRYVESCTAVTLRDADSLAELRAMGVARADISVTADPAFTLTADPDGPRRLRTLGVPEGVPVVGVSVRRVSGVNGDPTAFAALCDRVSRELGCAVVFLVMQEPGDSELSRQIMAAMEAPAWLVETPDRPEAMLGIIDSMDALISMRLHTIIFAARQRVPVVGCVYDPKVEAFLKLLNMPSCGTPAALDEAGALSALRTLLEDRENVRRDLDLRVRAMEDKTRQTLTLLQEMLAREQIIR